MNLATAAKSCGHAAGDTFTGIKNLTGSAQDVTLTGNAEHNVLSGGAGNHTLTGSCGNDALNDGHRVSSKDIPPHFRVYTFS